MFLKLNHQKLDIYVASGQFVMETYKLSKLLPSSEKFGMIAQIRRAALDIANDLQYLAGLSLENYPSP